MASVEEPTTLNEIEATETKETTIEESGTEIPATEPTAQEASVATTIEAAPQTEETKEVVSEEKTREIVIEDEDPTAEETTEKEATATAPAPAPEENIEENKTAEAAYEATTVEKTEA